MGKILIVDDEPLVCETLEVVLRREGHDVITASDGVDALRKARDNDLDVVVADIVMPEKDGLETIQELRTTYPELKIIAISGGSRIGNFDFLKTAEKLGATKTFYKPLDNKLLAAAVKECMD